MKKTAIKMLLVAVIPILLASCAGGQAEIRQAERQCQARGIAPDNLAFKGCIDQALDAIYISWARDRLSKGDEGMLTDNPGA